MVETKHPYYFVARQGFERLLAADPGGAQVGPLVSRLVGPLRAALESGNPEVFQAGLSGLVQLSNTVGPVLNTHLKMLIGQLGKKVRAGACGAIVGTATQATVGWGKGLAFIFRGCAPVVHLCCARTGRLSNAVEFLSSGAPSVSESHPSAGCAARLLVASSKKRQQPRSTRWKRMAAMSATS